MAELDQQKGRCTEEEALRRLSQRPAAKFIENHPFAKTFGVNAATKIFDLVEEDAILDVDSMVLQGFFGSKEEVTEYLRIMPQFCELAKKIMQTVFDIVEEITQERIDNWIQTSVEKAERASGYTREQREVATLTRILASRQQATQPAQSQSRPQGPIDIQGLVRSSIPVAAQRIKIDTGPGFKVAAKTLLETRLARAFVEAKNVVAILKVKGDTYRNAVAEDIAHLIEEFLAVRIIRALENPKYKPHQRNIIVLIFDQLNKQFKAQFDIMFIGVSLLNVMNSVKDVNRSNEETMGSFIDAAKQEDNEDIPIDTLREWAEFHTFKPQSIQVGDAELQIYGDKYETNKTSVICYGRLVLDKTKPIRDPEKVMLDGGKRTRMSFFENKGCIDFQLDRNTGELVLVATNIQLNAFAMNDADYGVLKRKFYYEVANYVLGREPDLPEYLAASSISEAVNSAPSMIEDVAEEVRHVYVPYKKPEAAVSEQAPELPNPQAIPPEERKQYKPLGSLSSRRIVQAFTRLLGEPVSGKGSHLVFTAKDNVTRRSLPLGHPVEISYKILLSFLRQLQVTPDEFIAAL